MFRRIPPRIKRPGFPDIMGPQVAAFLHKAVGPTGRVYGIDISPGMLRKAQKSCDANGWDNVELMQCDAAAFTALTPLDGVLFSLSYNTMPDHRSVLRRAWTNLCRVAA
jgi:ubiquinone/menaquinone biosynthesis C-methylase UbiE